MLLAFLCSDVVLLTGTVCAMFYQMVCIYKQPPAPHSPQHATHSSAFLVPVAVLSVGGVCVRKKERERRKSVEAMVHRPDGFKQTPSKAKDEMNHLGAILLEGV